MANLVRLTTASNGKPIDVDLSTAVSYYSFRNRTIINLHGMKKVMVSESVDHVAELFAGKTTS